MGYGCNYQAYLSKSVKKDNVATVTVHKWKAVFYKSYMEKMAFQVVMIQTSISYVLSLLIPNGWQKNSAPMEF